MKKQELDNILKILAEEAKKIKKKKKKHFSPVAIAPTRRPMGSIFSMDAAVSMAENLNEGIGQKPVPKKFDHLKWKLDQFQKHFLEDFINIPDEDLKEKDFEYASKKTGIPIASIKSIKNTYAEKKSPEAEATDMKRVLSHLGLAGGSLDQNTIDDANKEFTGARDLPKSNSGKDWSMNPNPEFRNKSLHQIDYEDKLAAEAGGGLRKKHERELPDFMYEWLLYFIEGGENNKITESKLMNDFNSTNFKKYKFILFSFDVTLKESNAHAYDNVSTDAKLKQLAEFRDNLKEFNSTFGTNFVIYNQFTGTDGFLKVVVENAQITDGNRVYNREIIDMENTDIKKAISLGYYDKFTTTRSIT